jgi:outer membrane assembly lipoprotein YfiO
MIFALSSFGQEDSVASADTLVKNSDTTATIEEIVTENEEKQNLGVEDEVVIVSQDTIVVGDTTFIVYTHEQYTGEPEPKMSRRERRKKRAKNFRCEERMRAGMEAFEKGRISRAINFLSLVRNNCSGKMDDPDSVYFFLGLSYIKAKKFEDARMELRMIIEEFPLSEFTEQTYFLLAYSSFRAAPIIERENRLLRRAEREFASFISAYPGSVWADTSRIFLDTITDKLLQKEILTAEFYEIIRRFESAVIYYEILLEDYVGHRRIPEIRLRLARNLIAAQRFAEANEQIEILKSQNLFTNEIENLQRLESRRKRRR